MSVFDVPKITQKLTLHRGGGIRSEGLIFLEYSPQDLPVHRRMSAFLEEERAFFPFLLTGTKTTELINKNNIFMVEVEYPIGPQGDGPDVGLMPIDSITAVFTTGESVSGELMAETTAERSRPSDCLNLNGGFICVRAGRKAFYINKKMLQKVTPRERSGVEKRA